MQLDKEIEKEKLIEILSIQYSQGLIAMDEYERILEFINKVETIKEIEYIRKIIDTNETYSLKKQIIISENTIIEPSSKPKNIFSRFFIKKISQRSNIKHIKKYSGTYELRLYDMDFIENNLTLKIRLYAGDVILYLPNNTVIQNGMKHYGGKIIMNETYSIKDENVRNKLL
jgi:hypothetical protein